jgi:hypothetical protein
MRPGTTHQSCMPLSMPPPTSSPRAARIEQDALLCTPSVSHLQLFGRWFAGACGWTVAITVADRHQAKCRLAFPCYTHATACTLRHCDIAFIVQHIPHSVGTDASRTYILVRPVSDGCLTGDGVRVGERDGLTIREQLSHGFSHGLRTVMHARVTGFLYTAQGSRLRPCLP